MKIPLKINFLQISTYSNIEYTYRTLQIHNKRSITIPAQEKCEMHQTPALCVQYSIDNIIYIPLNEIERTAIEV